MSEGKYRCEGNKIVNVKTGLPIPEDEPIFILRAKDRYSYVVMLFYSWLCRNDYHEEGVRRRMDEFSEWQKNNPGKVIEPGDKK